MQEGGRREPRHQRRVLDRIPGVVATPADLLVGPVRAEQLADAERRPGDERPAARGDDPPLVRATGEQRAHREGERDRQPDVAEVEQRRVGHHVRVLEARVQAGPVRRRRPAWRTASPRRRAGTRRRPRRRRPPGRPRRRDRARPAVEQDRSRSVAGQDQQPEEERSLLPAPEGGDRVAGRQLAARVLRDVDEREVVADERREEDDRGDGARDEGADERVRAETARRRRPFQAAIEPATTAKSASPSVATSAARPSSGKLRSSSWRCTSTGTSSRASPSSRRRRRSGARP